jgi:Mg/Co/Ni transporter MgtE
LTQLFEGLQKEGLAVAYTMEDFRRQFIKEHFADLTPAERREILASLPPAEREEVLQALPPEERLAGLPAEARLAGLPAEARLAGLSAEQIRQYLDRLTAGHSATTHKRRRKR